MNNVKSIIQKWNILIEGLKNDMLNMDFFTDVVKETYYYFKDICNNTFIDQKRKLTADEEELIDVIFSYRHQDAPALAETQRLYYATQIVAGMLEFADYHTAPLIQMYMSSEKGSAELEYNVDTGDLSNIMENIDKV